MSDIRSVTLPPSSSIALSASRPQAPGPDETGSPSPAEKADRAPLHVGPDGRPLAGPPPAFQASLLELEADIEAAIRRLAAARQESWPSLERRTADAGPGGGPGAAPGDPASAGPAEPPGPPIPPL